MIPRRLVAALIIVSLGAAPLEARTFESVFQGPARPLGQALTATVALDPGDLRVAGALVVRMPTGR